MVHKILKRDCILNFSLSIYLCMFTCICEIISNNCSNFRVNIKYKVYLDALIPLQLQYILLSIIRNSVVSSIYPTEYAALQHQVKPKQNKIKQRKNQEIGN